MNLLKPRDWSQNLLLTSADMATELARTLRKHLTAGDVLLLSGPIGAGKSHFARALIGALLADHNVSEDIPSPTFTLVQTYQAGRLEIWHSDLYRLSLIDEVAELGLLDAFETALCLVEWPERLGDEAPKDALALDFRLCDHPDHRLLVASANAGKWDWARPLFDKAVEND